MENLSQSTSNVVEKQCENCKNGNMRFNGIINMTEPKTYEHMCGSCGTKATYSIKYPQVY